jgi:hypothetical protein
MKSILRNEIHPIKMSTNPPEEIVNCGYKVINNKDGIIYQYVGIGWVAGEKATMEDHKNIPQLI